MGKLKIVVVSLLILTAVGVGAVAAYNFFLNPNAQQGSNTSPDKSIAVSNLSINRSVEDASAVDLFGIVKNNSQTPKSVILNVTLRDAQNKDIFTESIAVENIAPNTKKVFTITSVKGYADSKDIQIKADVVDVFPVQE